MSNTVSFLLSFIFLSGLSQLAASDLDHLISPEIKNDSFYTAIYRLAKTEELHHILEIGSSSGEGSTEAFVRGIKENPHHPILFCLELSKPRFNALRAHYANEPSVICYNVSSVSLADFPSAEEVIHFMSTTETSLRQFHPSEVIRWLVQDIDYLKEANVPQDGIMRIKTEHGIEHFDMVLIDGSEFTGKAELKLTYGAKYILLDDIRAFKNAHNYLRLLHDPQYSLLEVEPFLRNGYAIFKKNT